MTYHCSPKLIPPIELAVSIAANVIQRYHTMSGGCPVCNALEGFPRAKCTICIQSSPLFTRLRRTGFRVEFTKKIAEHTDRSRTIVWKGG